MNVALHPQKKKKNPYIFCVDMTESNHVAVAPRIRIVTRPYGTTTRSFDPDNDISSPTRIGCLASRHQQYELGRADMEKNLG